MSDIIDHGFDTAPEPDEQPVDAEVTPDDGTLVEDQPEQGTGEAEVEEPAPSDDPVHRVKVDGEEFEVPLSELVAGYQRSADYTRKTQALADQRKTLADAEALLSALQRNPQQTLVVLAEAYGLRGQEPDEQGGEYLSEEETRITPLCGDVDVPREAHWRGDPARRKTPRDRSPERVPISGPLR